MGRHPFHWARKGAALAGQRGQALVVIVLLMVVLIALLALVIDVGNVYAQRHQMQNAADAGALAGAVALAKNSLASDVEATVRNYAITRNGAEAVTTDIRGPAVTVVVSKTVRTFFAGVVGIYSLDIQASAKAGYQGVGAMTGLVPVALRRDVWQVGQAVTIWDSDKTEGFNVGDGQRGWLSFDGSYGASKLREWIENGYQGVVRVGDAFEGAPGVKTTDLRAFESKIGQVVYVPIYDHIDSQGRYVICGFAAFRVADVNTQGSNKTLTGTFEYSTSTFEPGPSDYGLRTVRLLE